MRAAVLGMAAASLLAVALPAGAAVGAASPGFDFATHIADYKMSLAYARLAGGVTGASGTMTYRFRDTCDGWSVENRTNLNFSYGADPPVATNWDFTTWESKDGQRYRFRVRSTRNGEVDQMIDGTAELDKTGAGTAHYTQPVNKTIKLPKGTVFPTQHTAVLLDAAGHGTHVIGRVLFDGSDDAGPTEASAAIGKVRLANQPLSAALSKPGIAADLLSAQSWPMEIAFFPLKGKQAQPDYQVGVRYYLNGVADTVLQSFDDFTVSGSLVRLRPLPKPKC